MTIWILGALLIGGMAALGRQIGSIRIGVSAIGAIVAYVGTVFLAPLVSPHMSAIGLKNPITVWWLTPVVVYVLLFLVMNGIAQGIYMKVNLFFQYRAKEDARMRFQKMDDNVGLGLGILNGCVLLSVISVPIYVAGHVTVQFKSDDDPIHYSMISKMRTDLTSSGLDKIARALAPDTEDLFRMADTLSLIYHNPSIQDFLPEYPPFYALAESETIQQYLDDEEFSGLVTQKGALAKIFEHSTTLELIDNSDFMNVVRELDYEDFSAFIETGSSPMYAEDPIVGKWRIDVGRSVREYGKKFQQLRPTILGRVPNYVTARWRDLTLIVAPDNTAYLKGGDGKFPTFGQLYVMAQQRLPIAPLRGGVELKPIASGNWGGDNPAFTISLTPGGKTDAKCELKGGFLNFIQSNNTCVFYKYL